VIQLSQKALALAKSASNPPPRTKGIEDDGTEQPSPPQRRHDSDDESAEPPRRRIDAHA
jgi:hypothetical protein